MSFNAFQVMRDSKKGGSPVRPADPLPEMTVEEAVDHLDRFTCLILSSLMQRKQGADKTYLHDPRNAGAGTRAREAASCCAKWERTGAEMKRNFSSETWKELIQFTSLERVQLLCQSPLLSPSVLWRLVLTETINPED